MTFPKRWQDCESFIESLVMRDYVTKDEAGDVKTIMPDGIYHYLYELWQDGFAHALSTAQKEQVPSEPK